MRWLLVLFLLCVTVFILFCFFLISLQIFSFFLSSLLHLFLSSIACGISYLLLCVFCSFIDNLNTPQESKKKKKKLLFVEQKNAFQVSRLSVVSLQKKNKKENKQKKTGFYQGVCCHFHVSTAWLRAEFCYKATVYRLKMVKNESERTNKMDLLLHNSMLLPAGTPLLFRSCSTTHHHSSQFSFSLPVCVQVYFCFVLTYLSLLQNLFYFSFSILFAVTFAPIFYVFAIHC